MKESTSLRAILRQLERKARALGLTDSDWAAGAGIRKETLCRLRARESCDFATLDALARTVGSRIGVVEGEVASTEDGRFPARISRDDEERLVELCASRSVEVRAWRALGPGFFMAGLAVMLASVPGFDRRALLELAEQLHAGSSQAGVFAIWLEQSPLKPSRFLPIVTASMGKHAA